VPCSKEELESTAEFDNIFTETFNITLKQVTELVINNHLKNKLTRYTNFFSRLLKTKPAKSIQNTTTISNQEKNKKPIKSLNVRNFFILFYIQNIKTMKNLFKLTFKLYK